MQHSSEGIEQETINRELICSNRHRIEQLRRDEDALARMVVSQQSEITRMQVRLNEQETVILLLCRGRGIAPKESKP